MASVSVCIPVYNGARFLAETIRSVLDQTYRDFELIVLDNASTDGSGGIAQSFAERDSRVRIERNPTTLSQPDNWNRVVQLSRSPLVKVVCADDLLHPRCLEFQVTPMEADPGLALVASRRHMIDEQSRVIVPNRGLAGLTGVRTGVEVARKVVRNGSNPIGESNNVLFRREDFFAVGGWRADRTYIMDLDLWLRLLQYGEFLGLPETLAAFRPTTPRGSTSSSGCSWRRSANRPSSRSAASTSRSGDCSHLPGAPAGGPCTRSRRSPRAATKGATRPEPRTSPEAAMTG
jgi:glycosyltransferase involved in cell wall biosynthesis